MRNTILALCLAFPMILNASGPSAEELALAKARRNGALAKECLRVVDQDGMPVFGARIDGGLQTGDGYNDYTPIKGATDTNGEFVVQGKCTNRIRCGITKEGYYASEFVLPNYAYRHSFKDGKWIPYGSQHTVVIKKIINPQPMSFHDERTSFKVPVYDEWIGFDCEKYDFVSPYGQGVENDMLLRFTLNNPTRDDYHMTMEVSFTNNPYAGACEMERTGMSEFESVYHADTNAVYRQSFMYRFDQSPGKVPEYTAQLKSDKYLIFRTRTKVDSEGRLVSAMYGKIYGDWNFVGPGGMSMAQFVFNPRPNDTNLEDEHTAEYSRKCQRPREELSAKKRKSIWPFR
jgi:hypothetical protein